MHFSVQLAAALHNLSVTDGLSAETLKCSRKLWDAVAQTLMQTNKKISDLKKSISSWHGASEVREILTSCQNVDNAHRRFQRVFATGNHYRLAWLELKTDCETFKPNRALRTLINRMRGDEMNGRLDLARDALNRAEYNYTKYNQFAEYVMDEAKRCAILAITCLSITYDNATTQELAIFHMENKQHLEEINESLELGFDSLKNEFFDQQLDQDLSKQLSLGSEINHDLYQETDMMFIFLSNKYPFRGWAVFRFDRHNDWPADSAIWGFDDRYKELVDYREDDDSKSNLIVHAAKQYERNCSSFRDLILNKTLEQHLTSEQFERLQKETNLRLSVDILKEWLINLDKVPNRLFAFVVRYTPLHHFKYNSDYHYAEIILNKDGVRDKIVLVGWC